MKYYIVTVDRYIKYKIDIYRGGLNMYKTGEKPRSKFRVVVGWSL